MKKAIVIGGGVTRLSVAWKLSEKGYKVKILINSLMPLQHAGKTP